MSVMVQCYQCSNILELDEGFRGGVCRCSRCGALLQVPKASGPGGPPRARPAAPGAAPTTPRRPGSPNDDPGLSRGQFDPRSGSGQATPAGPAPGDPRSGVRGRPDMGGSSGAIRRGARPGAGVGGAVKVERVTPVPGAVPGSLSGTGPVPTSPAAARAVKARQIRNNRVLFYVGLSLVLLILIVGGWVLAMLMVRGLTATSQPAAATAGAGTAGASAAGGGGGTVETRSLGYFGVPLTGKRVVLSIDASSSMIDHFEKVIAGAVIAIENLRDDQEVRIAVWHGDGVETIPASGFVTRGQMEQIREGLRAVGPVGSHAPGPCIAASLKLGGDQTVLITAKTDLSFDPTPALAARTGGQRVDAIWITSESAADSPLKKLADTTGGKYQTLTGGQVSTYYSR